MRVLVFGGTGAMGAHVVDILDQKGAEVYVTTRRQRPDRGNVHYIVGDAKDNEFVKSLCSDLWDVIIDFMVYSTELLKSRIELLLSASKQYVFISSARVYADCDGRIHEDSPRLLDVCEDAEYLKTDEYALAKAKEENILFHAQQKNWTIIRPSLTYGEDRLQLGVYEKENWLYRALHGRAIVFSKDLLHKRYTLTYGKDVANGIAAVLGKENALGQAYHLVVDRSVIWEDVLNLYVKVLEEQMGKRPNIVLTEKSTNLKLKDAKYQVLYGRYFDREFDNSKISAFIDTNDWVDASDGLRNCMTSFLKNPRFGPIDWRKEALLDKAAQEWTPIKEIPGRKNKLHYFFYRFLG